MPARQLLAPTSDFSHRGLAIMPHCQLAHRPAEPILPHHPQSPDGVGDRHHLEIGDGVRPVVLDARARVEARQRSESCRTVWKGGMVRAKNSRARPSCVPKFKTSYIHVGDSTASGATSGRAQAVSAQPVASHARRSPVVSGLVTRDATPPRTATQARRTGTQPPAAEITAFHTLRTKVHKTRSRPRDRAAGPSATHMHHGHAARRS